MAERQRKVVEDGLYGRLLGRLALALDAADSARFRLEQGGELELSDLTQAEFELIRAYLDRDLRWLRGWQAAAEELEQIERLPANVESLRKTVGRSLNKPRVLLKRRQALLCALCGEAAQWHRGHGVHACTACGSQLFRAGKPR